MTPGEKAQTGRSLSNVDPVPSNNFRTCLSSVYRGAYYAQAWRLPECRYVTYCSVLFQNMTDGTRSIPASKPEFFSDLNLDQIVAAVTLDKEAYDLSVFFYEPLSDIDDIAFRQEVMRDLECPELFDDIRTFADSMRNVHNCFSRVGKLHNTLQKQRWFLDAADTYCAAVVHLSDCLSSADLASCALSAFRDHIKNYAVSGHFSSLHRQTRQLTAGLSAIRYTLFIDGLRVQVRRYENACDYGAEVQTAFEQFRQGAVEEHTFKFSDFEEMNYVEVEILERVVKLYPDLFSSLDAFVSENSDFLDPAIALFEREIQFYIAWLEYLAPFKQAGLSFCYPNIAQTDKEIYDYQGFDLALAGRLVGENSLPVCNDFHIRGRERIIVISGPNQGGKTTFARTFGQLHYLASLGCPVPGTQARLLFFDKLLTHFEREEDISNLHGKLQDDLVRIHHILQHATPNSIIIMNEIFASTTSRDASVMSMEIAQRIMQLDLICVWVTFLDELASLSEKTVSMVSTVAPDNPAQRTFKVVRRPANGLAYALSIAEKYRLTYVDINKRLGS